MATHSHDDHSHGHADVPAHGHGHGDVPAHDADIEHGIGAAPAIAIIPESSGLDKLLNMLAPATWIGMIAFGILMIIGHPAEPLILEHSEGGAKQETTAPAATPEQPQPNAEQGEPSR